MPHQGERKESMKEFYLKLSEGEYSSYSPDYYVGNNEITQKELDEKGKTVGDEVIKEYKDVDSYEWSGKWKLKMDKWLEERGYIKLPDDLPEINVCYSEIPHH